MGCRPIIGIDGCHLKGIYKGQVFCAIAKDGNEGIYPIAYAVVELETKETWCWFLERLISDIGSNNLTFMSDRQKVSKSNFLYQFSLVVLNLHFNVVDAGAARSCTIGCAISS